MKKFVFSLERMHNYKEQILDKEKSTLALLNSKKITCEKKIIELESFLMEVKQEMLIKQTRGLTISQMSSYRFTIENCNYQMSDLKNQIFMLEGEIARQMEVVLKASTEVQGLNKLEHHQRQQYHKMVAKKEAEDILEIVSMELNREKMLI